MLCGWKTQRARINNQIKLHIMFSTTRFASCLLMISIFVCEALASDYASNPETGTYSGELTELAPLLAHEEYIRQVHSIINAYKADLLDGRMLIETKSLIDTKYKTYKRNADLINSILSLPKNMNDAGR